MPKIQVQLPFGNSLPTPGELGWNIGTPTVRGDEHVYQKQQDEEKDYNPDDPECIGETCGWQIG